MIVGQAIDLEIRPETCMENSLHEINDHEQIEMYYIVSFVIIIKLLQVKANTSLPNLEEFRNKSTCVYFPLTLM